MHIRPTRCLEVGFFNAKYNLEGKLCKEYISGDWGNDSKIKELIAINNKKNNDKKNL